MTSSQERGKRLAGQRAAEYVDDGMRVGLGSGSTVHYTIEALGARKPEIRCVATSNRTHELATRLGLKVVAPDELGALDLAIDGADEVDRNLNLIKGGGGAHAREKIVQEMAARFIVVVDDSKLVEFLGRVALPVEALPFAPGIVEARVRELGATRITRRSELSANGNVLLDAQFPSVPEPALLARQLKTIPGIVEHGLFLADGVERVVVGGATGVQEIPASPNQ